MTVVVVTNEYRPKAGHGPVRRKFDAQSFEITGTDGNQLPILSLTDKEGEVIAAFSEWMFAYVGDDDPAVEGAEISEGEDAGDSPSAERAVTSVNTPEGDHLRIA